MTKKETGALSPEVWKELLDSYPELTEDLEQLPQSDTSNLLSIIGIYSILKVRLWNLWSDEVPHTDSDEQEIEELPRGSH